MQTRLNQKDLRILALWDKGMPAERIAKKIGYPPETGAQRVREAIEKRSKINTV